MKNLKKVQTLDASIFSNTLLNKSWSDTNFKNRLISNPNETINELMGKEIHFPNGKKVIVEDQSDESIIFLNIPAKISQEESLELDDEQLELVSGGEFLIGAAILTGIAASAITYAAIEFGNGMYNAWKDEQQ